MKWQGTQVLKQKTPDTGESWGLRGDGGKALYRCSYKTDTQISSKYGKDSHSISLIGCNLKDRYQQVLEQYGEIETVKHYCWQCKVI